MKLLVVIGQLLELLEILSISVYFLAQRVVGLLAGFQIVLLLLAGLPDISVEVLDHLLDVHPHSVDVLVLDLDFFGDTLPQRGHILEHLAALLHADVQDLELLIHVLVFLVDLARKLLDFLLLLLEPPVDACKNASLEYLGVVLDHESQLLDFLIAFGLVVLELIDDARALQNALLEGPQNLLDNLPYFGLHLEPLEFFNLELEVLTGWGL